MADYGSVSKDFIYKAGEGYATNGVDGVKSAAKNTAKKIGKDMVFGAISDALTVAATDSGSASAKAAAGTAANVQTLQTVAEIMESLATHKGSYTDMLGQILSGNEQVNALAENATGVLGSAVNCVNGNGDLVGLSLDLAQTGMDEYKRSEGRNNGEMAGGQIAQSGCNNNQSASSCGGANPVSTSQPVANQQQEAPVISPTPKTEEPQKVYSCDWGAGAKTSDEIEAKNEEIKETKDDTSIKDVKSDESNKSEKKEKTDKSDDAKKLNNDDAKIKEELEKIKKEKDNLKEKMELESSDGEDDEDEELKKRVQGDADGVTATDAQNAEGLSAENEMKKKITNNNKKNEKDITDADSLTNNAKAMATGAAATMLGAVASNTTAAALFSNPYTMAGAVAAATAACGINVAARAVCEQASDIEQRSQEKQADVIALSESTLDEVLPQFEGMVNGRLANNEASKGIQLATREYIESKKDGSKGSDILSSMLDGLNGEESKLLAKNDKNQQQIAGFNTLNSGNSSKSAPISSYPLDLVC